MPASASSARQRSTPRCRHVGSSTTTSRVFRSRHRCSGRSTHVRSSMLDDRVRAVLGRLQQEDAEERERGLPAAERSRAVAPTTGQFLFALVAPQVDCEVLEIGASRGYSTVWLAAGVRSSRRPRALLENDPAKIGGLAARTSPRPASTEWAELIEGDAKETVPAIDDVFDVVFLDAEKEDYEELFQPARTKLEPGALVVADNVLSHQETLGAYSRRGRPTQPRVASPFRSTAASSSRSSCGTVGAPDRLLYSGANRGKEVVREWRFPVRAVEVPAGRGASPGPTGNRLASVGDDALRAARPNSRAEAGSASTNPPLVTGSGPPRGGPFLLLRRRGAADRRAGRAGTANVRTASSFETTLSPCSSIFSRSRVSGMLPGSRSVTSAFTRIQATGTWTLGGAAPGALEPRPELVPADDVRAAELKSAGDVLARHRVGEVVRHVVRPDRLDALLAAADDRRHRRELRELDERRQDAAVAPEDEARPEDHVREPEPGRAAPSPTSRRSRARGPSSPRSSRARSCARTAERRRPSLQRGGRASPRP